MLKKLSGATFLILAVVVAARCHDDNNMIVNPVPTSTPAPGGPTSTPVPGAPTPTRTPVPTQMATVQVGAGGGNVFMDQQSGSSTTTIHVGDTVQWVWVSGFHSTTSGSCSGGGCLPDGKWDSGVGSGMTFSHTFTQAGTYPYFCSAHLAMMQGTVVVQ